MKFNYIFVFLFLTTSAFASDVSIFTSKNHEIFLRGPDCKQLQKSEDDIINWTKKIEDRTSMPNNCFCEKNECTINITESVPIFVKNWHGKLSKTLSGNCWNTMFRVGGILPTIKVTSPEELHFILNSPFICKERKRNEQVQIGDFILVRSNDSSEIDRELHGYVYINDELSFEKEQSGVGGPIEITDSRYSSHYYKIESTCKNMFGNPPIDPEIRKKCSTYTNTYTCSTIKKVLNNKNKSIAISTQNKLSKIDNIECNLQNFISLPVSKVNVNSLELMRNSLNVLKKWAELQSPKAKNEADKFFISYIQNRAMGSIKYIDSSLEIIKNTIKQDTNEESVDTKIEEAEKIGAEEYLKYKEKVDTLYSLQSFTNKNHRLPQNTFESTSAEKALYSNLVKFEIFKLINEDPQQIESYLNDKVYRSLIENKN